VATAALTLAQYVTFTAALKFCLRLVKFVDDDDDDDDGCSDAHSGQSGDVRRFVSIEAWLRYEAARRSRNQGRSLNFPPELISTVL